MIDLTTWNLTIPEETPALTISTAALNAEYSSQYFYQTDSALFFWAPVTGTTTNGSTYPRSELRETLASGIQNNWYHTEGSHYLNATLAVTQVPSSGKVIVGQIHSKDNSTPFAKVVYRHISGVGYVNVEIRQLPGDLKSPSVLTYKSMPLNQPFSYSFAITNRDELTVTVDGLSHTQRIDPEWASKRMYFKAGMYSIDNEGPETEGGRAEFYSLNLEHRP